MSQMPLKTVEAQSKVLGALLIGTMGTPVTGLTGIHLILYCLENRDTVSGWGKVKAAQPEVVVAEMVGSGQRDMLSNHPGTGKQLESF